MVEIMLISLPGVAQQNPQHPGTPTYDCARADNGTEKTICAHPGLAVLDVELDLAYRALKKRCLDTQDPLVLRALLQEQKRWLRTRNQCHRNADCIARSYHQRIKHLQDWSYARRRRSDLFAGRYYRFAHEYGELKIAPVVQEKGYYRYSLFLTLNNPSHTHCDVNGKAVVSPQNRHQLSAVGLEPDKLDFKRTERGIVIEGDRCGFMKGFLFKVR